MSCYFIAQVEIQDRQAYKQYIKAFLSTFANYRGQVLVSDESPRLLEGQWRCSRTVIIRFDDEPEALRWYQSDNYQAAVRLREGCSSCNLVLVKGLPHT
jgi:uncharacterized protein (DUF1330 family)